MGFIDDFYSNKIALRRAQTMPEDEAQKILDWTQSQGMTEGVPETDAKISRGPAVKQPIMSDLSAVPSEFSEPTTAVHALDYSSLMPDPMEKLARQKAQMQLQIMGAVADNLANRQSSGNFYLGRFAPKQDVAGVADKIAAGLPDYSQQKKEELEAKRSAIMMEELERGRRREIEENDPASQKSKVFRGLLANMGVKVPNNLTAAQIKSASPMLTQIAEQKFKAEQARQAKELELGKEFQKRQQDESRLTVPGFRRSGNITPTPEEAQKLRSSMSGAENFLSELDEYVNLVKKDGNGNFEMFGPDSARMKTLATSLQLKAKSPAQYDLGALSGPDLDMIEKLVQDPSSFSAFFTSTDTALAGLDQLRDSLSNKAMSMAKGSGYEVDSGNRKRINELLEKARTP